MKKSSNKGFTLVELIIVIAILAIIMLIAIPNFSGIQQRMQVRADKATAAQIGKAVRVWFTDFTTDSGMAAGITTSTVEDVIPDIAANANGTALSTNAFTGGEIQEGAQTVTNYEKLYMIDQYITRGQKPQSLKPAGKADSTQYYGVFLTTDSTNTASKIAVAIATPTAAAAVAGVHDAIVADTVTIELDDTTGKIKDNYDGSEPGIAYVEP